MNENKKLSQIEWMNNIKKIKPNFMNEWKLKIQKSSQFLWMNKDKKHKKIKPNFMNGWMNE